MVTNYTNYRSFLKSRFEERVIRNPKYSLRAMAKQLNLSPATLSSVLNGKRNLSAEKATQIARLLDLSESDTEFFLLLIRLESTNNAELRIATLRRLRELGGSSHAQDLTLDHFRVISDWHHFAILALTEVETFEFSSRNVASAFGISKVEVDMAIERLERLEMLTQVDGRYVKVKQNPRVVSVAPNQAIRNFHKQTMAKAVEALETQSNQEKFVGTETVAFDSSQLAEYARITEEYFSRVLALAQQSNRRDHVYHLAIQFFRLTQSK